ncbi:MAG TPA: GNAT family N-acetyltransferase [Gemmatimonadales bacterium]|nr:GNAT family N-acetyltransferase [Gemmatimonadales bacterium]
MISRRILKYYDDIRTFPTDAAEAWRAGGWRAVWDDLRGRTLDRIGNYARHYVIEMDLSQLAELTLPNGVEVGPYAGPDWQVLGNVVGRRLAAQHAEAAAAGRLCIVAWKDGRAVGCTWLSNTIQMRYESYDLPLPPDAVYILGTHVSPAERRLGVAAALVGTVLRLARQQGRNRAWTMVHPDNRGSLRTVVRVAPSRILGTVARIKLLSWMFNRFRPLDPPLALEAVTSS